MNSITTLVTIIFAAIGVLLFGAGLQLAGVGFGVLAVLTAFSLKMANNWERFVILRAGKLSSVKGPGLFMIIPVLDSVTAVIDERIQTTAFNAEQALTRDTVPVNVDAIVFWHVHDAQRAALNIGGGRRLRTDTIAARGDRQGTPITPTPPLLSLAMRSRYRINQGGKARIGSVDSRASGTPVRAASPRSRGRALTEMPFSVPMTDRQFLGREQGDHTATFVGDHHLFLDTCAGEAVGRRAISFQREHHAFPDLRWMIERDDA